MGFFKKLTRWNQSIGGLYYPEELRVQEHLALRERVSVADGVLAIYEYPADDDGSPIREKGRCLMCGDNLIVNLGRSAIRALQADTANGMPWAHGLMDLGYLGVGNGSGGGASVPAPGDIAMFNERTDPVAGPPVTGVPRPALTVTTPPPGPPYMTNLWSGQIGTTQLNGDLIDEAACWCLDDLTLFSFKSFAAQTKSAGFVMEFRWTHIF